MLGLFACSNEKNFPKTPQLEVREFREEFVAIGNGTEKLIFWTLGFTDGDGDIGVRNDDDADNFLVTIFYIEDGETKEIEGESYRIPVVRNIRTEKGIEGSFEFEIEAALLGIENNISLDSLIYEAFVIDRAGNESNKVSTPIFSAF